MAPDTLRPLAAKIDELIAMESVAYQSLQLAAQQADIEGHALAAAVLRSVSESHTGKVHGLLYIQEELGLSGESGLSMTERNLRAALAQNAAAAVLSQDLAAAAESVVDARTAEDLMAILGLTATNRTRLENQLKAVMAARDAATQA